MPSSGDEWLLEGVANLASLTECAEAICQAWPEAVVEDTAAGEFAHWVDALLPSEDSELCIYRDLDVARRWHRGGPPDEVRNSMIQISLNPRGLRLIADDWQDPSLDEVVTAIDRWLIGPVRRTGHARVDPVRRTGPRAGVPRCGKP